MARIVTLGLMGTPSQVPFYWAALPRLRLKVVRRRVK